MDWHTASWRDKSAAQDVVYPDRNHLDRSSSFLLREAAIRSRSPACLPKSRDFHLSLLHPKFAFYLLLQSLLGTPQIERLKTQLAQVQNDQAFLLHAGDCAESFDACTMDNISNKIGLILSFSLILIWGARMPVVRIGRIAGQYAKPRSSPTELVAGKQVPSFRGDNVNGLDPNARTPDPERLLSAYFHSSSTLNYIRGLLTSGFADLSHPRDWSLSHVRSPALRSEYERIATGLSDALDFSRTIGAFSGGSYESGAGKGPLGEVDFYTSHEGLMLEFEEAMTRNLSIPASSIAPTSSTSTAPSKGFYNTSAHFIWIGDRTRQLTGAHVEYFRGIRNPIGIKVGPSMQPEELVRLINVVNPDRVEGKVTLITRYGAEKIALHLPGHINAVRDAGLKVIWVCDPMHGNTLTSSSGYKTRNFGTIISEIKSCLKIHEESGSRLGGISLEFTGELSEDGYSVTECLGGSMELSEEQLGLRYQSFCDPRLNFEQSLDLAFMISNHFKEGKSHADKKDVLYSVLGGK